MLRVGAKEEKRGCLIRLDGVAVPLEVKRGPAPQVILVLCFLRFVGEIAVLNGLGVPHIVDADDVSAD